MLNKTIHVYLTNDEPICEYMLEYDCYSYQIAIFAIISNVYLGESECFFAYDEQGIDTSGTRVLLAK